ncbi:MAG: hypothetical protein DRP65_00530 [Planctomycetota bacterium]|nr:MAG: hypothetical protein DRP65_00530 [Planctomycetota bacterium]
MPPASRGRWLKNEKYRQYLKIAERVDDAGMPKMNETNGIIDVSDDNILLQQVAEEHGVTAKQIAMLTGRAVSTVYKYLAGGLSIPSVVWRQLYQKTADPRIIQLITGDTLVAIVPLVPAAIKVDAPTLSKLIDARKKQIRCEEYAIKILEDGRVDEADKKAVAGYKKEFANMVVCQSQLFQAITGQFESVCGRSKA